MKSPNSLRVTRRGVQLALGFLWLLDGLLQLQHRMFTSAFASQVISPTADGQPRFVASFMHYWIHLCLAHPAVCNVMIVIIQLGIGILLLRRRTVRLGLLCSIVWGVFVWYVGEGLGGIFSAQANLLMGTPGAALLYVILSLAAVPADDDEQPRAEHVYPAPWLPFAWAFLWVGGAIYQLLPAQSSVASIIGMITNNAQGAPGWLAALDMHLANALGSFAAPGAQGSGYWLILLIAILEVAVGVGVFAQRSTRGIAVSVGIGLSILFWVFGQSLGQYWTGLATDPNTAPLFVLLGLAIIGQPAIDHGLAKIYKRLEELFV